MYMKINKNITTINHTRYTNRDIKYIVLHYFGAFGTAEANSKYFKSVNRQASAHYFVDETSVWQVVDDSNAAWHCGDSGKGVLKNQCTNRNSLGIEMRPNKMNRKSQGSTDRDWYFEQSTIDNTLELVKAKMEEYNIPIENVIRHGDITGKLCPRPFFGKDINLYYNQVANNLWLNFKEDLQKEDSLMNGETIVTLLRAYLKGLPTSQAPHTLAASKKGIASGLFVDGDGDGLIDNPKGFLTREELVVVLDRAGLLDK